MIDRIADDFLSIYEVLHAQASPVISGKERGEGNTPPSLLLKGSGRGNEPNVGTGALLPRPPTARRSGVYRPSGCLMEPREGSSIQQQTK